MLVQRSKPTTGIMNAVLRLCVFGLMAVTVWGQFGMSMRPPKRPKKCQYAEGPYTPFHVGGLDELCTDQMCAMDPNLACQYPEMEIQDAILNHYPENITKEVSFLHRYFNTLVPEVPRSKKDYQCVGACGREFVPLKRVFHTIEAYNDWTQQYEMSQKLCHVIGPKNIFYADCGFEVLEDPDTGETSKVAKSCDLSKISGISRLPYYCVPDTAFEIDVWIYCEDTYPSCIKKKMKLPLSCSCKKMRCLKKAPEAALGMLGPVAGLVDIGLSEPGTILGAAAIEGLSLGHAGGMGIGPDISVQKPNLRKKPKKVKKVPSGFGPKAV